MKWTKNQRKGAEWNWLAATLATSMYAFMIKYRPYCFETGLIEE
jgi:hypothetical protein